MITRIQILNYKCLEYVDVHLTPFQVLVGPNASGKSTLIDAIQLISDLQFGELEDSLFFRGWLTRHTPQIYLIVIATGSQQHAIR